MAIVELNDALCHPKLASYRIDLSVSIHIKSEGCEDPGIQEGTCGLANIFVNGTDKSPHSRGHNVVVVDAVTGNVTLVVKHPVKTWICSLRKAMNLASRQ